MWTDGTLINKSNPANASGKITNVRIYTGNAMSTVYVGIFYRPDPSGFPNNLTSRDSEYISDSIAAGYHAFNVDLTVETGDFLGIMFQNGDIEKKIGDEQGVWYINHADWLPCTDKTFSFQADNALALYGIGTITEPPDPPTNVQATDYHTDKVAIAWTKSAGATGYQVYRDGTPLGWLGDVSGYIDYEADAPTITHGTAYAGEDSYAYIGLSNPGASANVGTTHTYKVKARNAYGESGDSGTDTGYRGVGALTYQWWKSAADSDANYSLIPGAIYDNHADDEAPAPTITVGTASASKGTSADHVTLSIAGESANNGDGRYYKCYHTATGVTPGYTNVDRGYRKVGPLGYQWQRSAADSDADYSNIDGATTDPYNDTGAPENGDGRYYKCIENADGATQVTTNADRGYRLVPEFEYTGTGTFTYSGIATQIYTRDYLTTASGQLAYSGTAEQVYSKNYLYSGSGELAFSGEAVIIFGLAFVGSGSFAYSGEAVVTYTRDYLSTAVGELIYSGEAIFSYLCNFLFTGSGELAYSGSADQSYTSKFTYTGSGTFDFSGASEYVLGFTYNGSGSLTFSGIAGQEHSTDHVYGATGSFTFSGIGTYVLGFSYVADGSFTISGEGTYTLGFAYTSSGEFAYSGEAVQVHTKNYLTTGTGSFDFSGEGSYSLGFSYIGSGSFTYSGTATQVYLTDYLYTTSGSFTYSGAAICEYTIVGADFEYVGSGSFTYSGVSSYVLGFSYIGSGSLVYSGEAVQTHSKIFIYVADGTFTFGGAGTYTLGISYIGIVVPVGYKGNGIRFFQGYFQRLIQSKGRLIIFTSDRIT
ncbi:hypothetical protein ES705_28296 [subsurface metagenome]